jgi:hypothetical protein
MVSEESVVILVRGAIRECGVADLASAVSFCDSTDIQRNIAGVVPVVTLCCTPVPTVVVHDVITGDTDLCHKKVEVDITLDVFLPFGDVVVLAEVLQRRP